MGGIAALAARTTGRPCKLRLDRDADMVMTGKRHDFAVAYAVGYEADGRMRARGHRCSTPAADVRPICQPRRGRSRHVPCRQRLLPSRIQGSLRARIKTNTVSNTAFRGFGGPQGMMAIERVIDAIAWSRGLDPLDVRKANLYAAARNITPYGQTVEDHDRGAAADRAARTFIELSRPAAGDRGVQRAFADPEDGASRLRR